MKCKICNTQCFIPTTNDTRCSQTIGIKLDSGSYICTGCSDALDFANGLGFMEQKNKSKTSSNSNVKITLDKTNTVNQVYIRCGKCSQSFTGAKCLCGFVNPLYRKKK